ncbi:hypothetical protein [Sorangium sp. So ce363]|uniref:hypothetical protein n=1 Tax=Sorangium sp. So ce363 TaxID=3133304 RepID=UPI003F5FBF5C
MVVELQGNLVKHIDFGLAIARSGTGSPWSSTCTRRSRRSPGATRPPRTLADRGLALGAERDVEAVLRGILEGASRALGVADERAALSSRS